MEPDLIFQICGGVAVILFLVAVSMSYKSWRWYTIFFACVVFFASGVLYWLSVQTLKTHQTWRQIIEGPPGKPEEGLRYQTTETEKKIKETINGVRNDEGDIEVPGIVQLEAKIRGVVYDRGRIWTNCQPGAVNDESVTVQVNDPTPHHIQQDLLVYIFEGEEVDKYGERPIFKVTNYIGEFSVKAAAEPAAPAPAAAAGQVASPAVTLQSSWPMTQTEKARMASSSQGGKKWIICDKMPADGHFVFNFLDQCTAAELGVAEQELAELNREDRLAKLLPPSTLADYTRDLQPIGDNDPVGDERVELFVEFKSDYLAPFPYEDKYPEEGPLEDKDKQYRDDQKIWMPKQTEGEQRGADDLAADGIVEIDSDEKPRYVRSKRDYVLAFHDIYLQGGEFRLKVDAVDFDTEALNVIIKQKVTVIDRYKAEQARLTADHAGFLRDKSILAKLLGEVLAQEAAAIAYAKELREKNEALAEQIDQMQKRAVEAINQRTPAARGATALSQ
ncbi:MAG: hypothetical protein VX988_01985 [Planctomycetota bacterium]|nr:hypothetical protein [Planctomycetota bacterium]